MEAILSGAGATAHCTLNSITAIIGFTPFACNLLFQDRKAFHQLMIIVNIKKNILGCKLWIGVAKVDIGRATATSKQYEVSPLVPPQREPDHTYNQIPPLSQVPPLHRLLHFAECRP